MSEAAEGSRERLAAVALVLLILLPLGFLPRVLGEGVDQPRELRPAWMHLVVVSVGDWQPTSDADAGGVALERLRRRASGHPQLYAPSSSSAASAASLWTGRWPRGHGVRDNTLALAPDSWSLSEAARASGAATAAALEEPFVSATGIAGFELVEERPDLGPGGLLRAAHSLFEGERERRKLLWLHLADSGPNASAVEELLLGLDELLEAEGVQHDTMLLLTAFGRALEGDAAYRVPFLARLPTGLYAGRRASGAASQVDFAGDVMLELMRLPHPDESAGHAPLQSRPQSLGVGLKGAGKYQWVLLESPEELVMRHEHLRMSSPPELDRAARLMRTQDPASDELSSFRAQPAPQARQMALQLRATIDQIQLGAPQPTQAEVPLAFRALPGWGG